MNVTCPVLAQQTHLYECSYDQMWSWARYDYVFIAHVHDLVVTQKQSSSLLFTCSLLLIYNFYTSYPVKISNIHPHIAY